MSDCRALSRTADLSIIKKLTEILLCVGEANQFAVYFQLAVTETLSRLNAYDALEKLIASGQTVTDVVLPKDVVRLNKAGTAEKPENIRN